MSGLADQWVSRPVQYVSSGDMRAVRLIRTAPILFAESHFLRYALLLFCRDSDSASSGVHLRAEIYQHMGLS